MIIFIYWSMEKNSLIDWCSIGIFGRDAYERQVWWCEWSMISEILFLSIFKNEWIKEAQKKPCDQPVMNAGEDMLLDFAVVSSPWAEGGLIKSAVAWIGFESSKGEEGDLIRVTQKHLAIPCSSLINVILRPRSDRFFMFPRSTQVGANSLLSAGGEIIWLIRSKAFWRSSFAVKLNIVKPQISCFVYSDNWMKSWLQSINAPPMDAMACGSRWTVLVS